MSPQVSSRAMRMPARAAAAKASRAGARHSLSPLFRGERARVRGGQRRRSCLSPLTPTLSPRAGRGSRPSVAGRCRRSARTPPPPSGARAPRTDRRCGRRRSVRGACGLGGEAQQRRAVLHQPLVGLVRAIPFEHGERRMMQGAALAIAEDRREGEDLLLARGQQLLAGELRRGVQIERPSSCRRARSARSRRHAGASRCRARPAGRAVSTSTKPSRLEPARGSRPGYDRAPAGTAAGPRACLGATRGFSAGASARARLLLGDARKGL